MKKNRVLLMVVMILLLASCAKSVEPVMAVDLFSDSQSEAQLHTFEVLDGTQNKLEVVYDGKEAVLSTKGLKINIGAIGSDGNLRFHTIDFDKKQFFSYYDGDCVYAMIVLKSYDGGIVGLYLIPLDGMPNVVEPSKWDNTTATIRAFPEFPYPYPYDYRWVQNISTKEIAAVTGVQFVDNNCHNGWLQESEFLWGHIKYQSGKLVITQIEGLIPEDCW